MCVCAYTYIYMYVYTSSIYIYIHMVVVLYDVCFSPTRVPDWSPQPRTSEAETPPCYIRFWSRKGLYLDLQSAQNSGPRFQNREYKAVEGPLFWASLLWRSRYPPFNQCILSRIPSVQDDGTMHFSAPQEWDMRASKNV